MSQPGDGLFGGFESYRSPDTSDYATVLKHGMIVLDTNVLLDLYRYTDRAREQLLEVLSLFKDRLWVPHQVVKEFWRNRESALWDPVDQAESTTDALTQHKSNSQKALREWANRVSLDEQRQAELDSTLEDAYTALGSAILSFVNRDDVARARDTGNDLVLRQLQEVLEGRVGPAMGIDEYSKALAEAARRIAGNAPPGYKDKQKGDERSAGDFLVWEQTILEAQRRQTDVLLVTGDVQEDWWRKSRGEWRGPRLELIDELRVRAGVKLFMVRPKSLLFHASQAFKVKVEDEIIESVDRVDRSRSPEVDAWSPELARALLDSLDFEAPVQADAIRAASRNGGFVSRDEVYEIGNYEETRMLRGFTRPANRIARKIFDPQGLSDEPIDILTAVYDASYSYVQASGFQIPADLVEAVSALSR